ncbi:MAG: DUF4363 family protein [Clostridioides sp.]|nr:DUF4363 family protein [Clostridioides sp.]
MIEIKSTIFAIIFTILFVTFAVYNSDKVNSFTSEFDEQIIAIEAEIEADNWEDANKKAVSAYEYWNANKRRWYLTLDHGPFESVSTYLEVLQRATALEDKLSAFEQSELVRGQMRAIRGNVNFELDYIL